MGLSIDGSGGAVAGGGATGEDRRAGEILLVAGARPNFVKIAPISWALAGRKIPHSVVHTGQHYDPSMSEVFFRDLDLPPPAERLGVGQGTHVEQIAGVMRSLEPVLQGRRPAWVVVVGDVNSTLAAALAAAKIGIPTAHVEAGLRSNDRTMPEEVNRILVDRMADLLLTTSEDADANLLAEGTPEWRIRRTGNVMIDTLRRLLDRARSRRVPSSLGLVPRGYAVATLHRPANVDDPAVLAGIMAAIERVAGLMPVVLPVHPHLGAALSASGIADRDPGRGGPRLVGALGYLDFLGLMEASRLVLTDSGGVQEESSVLGIPCVTIRDTTERPITVSLGTNRLAGVREAGIVEAARAAAAEDVRPREIPLWDGKAAVRVVDAILGFVPRRRG